MREILTNNQSKENPNSARDTNATINQKNILTLYGNQHNNQSKENQNSAQDSNATILQNRILTVRQILTQQSMKRESLQYVRY